MASKKLSISDLKVQTFITQLNAEAGQTADIRGGGTGIYCSGDTGCYSDPGMNCGDTWEKCSDTSFNCNSDYGHCDDD